LAVDFDHNHNVEEEVFDQVSCPGFFASHACSSFVTPLGEEEEGGNDDEYDDDGRKNQSAGEEGDGGDDAGAPAAFPDLLRPLIATFIPFLSHALFCYCLHFRGATYVLSLEPGHVRYKQQLHSHQFEVVALLVEEQVVVQLVRADL
jgi:hypothetical protein